MMFFEFVLFNGYFRFCRIPEMPDARQQLTAHDTTIKRSSVNSIKNVINAHISIHNMPNILVSKIKYKTFF